MQSSPTAGVVVNCSWFISCKMNLEYGMWRACKAACAHHVPGWALIGLLAFGAGCANSTTVSETFGRVIDADTGAPVAGANVVAYWRVSYAPALVAMHRERATIH